MVSIRFGDDTAKLPKRTVRLVRLRAGRITLVPPCLSAAERAALSLVDAASALRDRGGGVSEEIWREAARHYDDATLAALVVEIARCLDRSAERTAELAA